MNDNSVLKQQQFLRFIQGVSIQSIEIENCHATVRDKNLRAAPESGLDLAYAHESHLLESHALGFDASVFYGVRVLPSPDANPDDSWMAQLEVEYRVRYASEIAITDEMFANFQEVTLRLNTIPFARQWMHETSLRMGIPPILIPLAVSKSNPVLDEKSGSELK